MLCDFNQFFRLPTVTNVKTGGDGPRVFGAGVGRVRFPEGRSAHSRILRSWRSFPWAAPL